MSIFESIKNAIFGKKAAAAPAAPTSTSPARPTAQTPTTSSVSPPSAVDVAAVMDGLAAKNAQKLQWRTSIVDLLKLLEIDSSLTHRKELAKELGYSGDTGDSATMNIWLHKQVMQKLKANGGKVPAELAD